MGTGLIFCDFFTPYVDAFLRILFLFRHGLHRFRCFFDMINRIYRIEWSRCHNPCWIRCNLGCISTYPVISGYEAPHLHCSHAFEIKTGTPASRRLGLRSSSYAPHERLPYKGLKFFGRFNPASSYIQSGPRNCDNIAKRSIRV